MMNPSNVSSAFSRRSFISLAAAAATLPLLAACSPGGSGGKSGGTIKFWDLPWGPPQYAKTAKRIAVNAGGKADYPKTVYQQIQWNNFITSFSAALASHTGPAVSTGGPIMSVQFSEKGWVAQADDVISSWKKSGLYNDFIEGTFEPYRSKNGYQAVPFQLDIRVLWYRKSLLEKAGVEVPTDWDSWIVAAKALKKIGLLGFGTGAGPGNNIGAQALLSLMINNGGGLFAPDGSPDCVTDRNIEAMDFVREMHAAGAIDRGAVSYSSDNLQSQWRNKRVALGFYSAGLDSAIGEVGSGDLVVAPPLTGPHGDKGTVSYPNNLIMYTNTPSQKGSEEVLTHFVQNMHVLWESGLMPGLPVLKSIAKSPAVQKSAPQHATVLRDWQPVAKTLRERAKEDSSRIESVDASAPLNTFAQTMTQGTTDSKAALAALEAGIKSLHK